MIETQKQYWFFVKPHVYIRNNGNSMLLYNTFDGEYIETDNNKFISLVREVHVKKDLGVVQLSTTYLSDPLCYELIEVAINKQIAECIEIDETKNKPVVLLPILSLQRDIDKLKGDDESMIGENAISYLTRINLFINNRCNLNCKDCQSYYKQTIYCTKKKDNNTTTLPLSQIDLILQQATNASVSRLNISGGNILLYPQWADLITVLNKYNFDYHFYIHYRNFKNERSITSLNISKLEILVNFPIDSDLLIKSIKQYKNDDDVTFHFLIEEEYQYEQVGMLIYDYNLINYKIIPYYTGDNYTFFENNIFLNKDDIFSFPIMQRKIFCNQKLNVNNFGLINIFSDGSVKANVNEQTIGNVYKNNLLEIVYKELKINTSWRKVRQSKPCANCLYQFLCPPLSNYEIVIGKPNLCNI